MRIRRTAPPTATPTTRDVDTPLLLEGEDEVPELVGVEGADGELREGGLRTAGVEGVLPPLLLPPPPEGGERVEGTAGVDPSPVGGDGADGTEGVVDGGGVVEDGGGREPGAGGEAEGMAGGVDGGEVVLDGTGKVVGGVVATGGLVVFVLPPGGDGAEVGDGAEDMEVEKGGATSVRNPLLLSMPSLWLA